MHKAGEAEFSAPAPVSASGDSALKDWEVKKEIQCDWSKMNGDIFLFHPCYMFLQALSKRLKRAFGR